MTLFRASIATSLDGYIATCDGGVGWLDPYFSPEIDFKGFMAEIGAILVGRATYDQSRGMGFGSSRSGPRSIVLTHRPIERPPRGVEAFSGDLRALADDLRREIEAPGPRQGKDVWLIGGGLSIRSFHELGLVDRFEIRVMPVLLGDGIPLFPRRAGGELPLKLVKSRSLTNGIVELHYEPAKSPTLPRARARKTSVGKGERAGEGSARPTRTRGRAVARERRSSRSGRA
jgi:dihydrofolate reductase